ncbi:glycoside hydrolase family 25 protein [Histidinibacterium aquaticum]|uniref:Glycoside hydrolase family 25 protein n=1 Tax=Histidinibacterium aquaticum TaxID=2613962 RepID=A0A5J5GQ21_9RHOB|nr:GH25 family lysozyme [Histidinibacterium aquaticum]KAA9010439.1 glycoside hydrolase family 25 protein [Histidinibacterium aquaticum]
MTTRAGRHLLTRRAMLAQACALAACGPRPPEERAPAGATAGYAGPPRDWGDLDPHDWPGGTPYRYPVHGVDASRYDGRPAWPTAAAAGVNFAWLKATEGGDIADPLFRSHWAETAAAGIPRGAYHVFYFCRPAVEQARWFIQHVPRTPGALPPVLDMEWHPTSPTCRIRPPAAQVRAEMRRFLELLTAHYGTRPLIYTVPDFFDDNDIGTFAGYEFWLRSTAAHLSERYPETPWRVWQYSGTGTLPGFDGSTDLNVFNGSPGRFRAWYDAVRVR